MNILQPEFYEKFQCQGDACPYHCCQSWEIIIDDTTMETYKTYEGDLAENVKKIHKNSKGFYCVQMDENRQCPFLDSHELCEIVKAKGPEALSFTCTTFPRNSLVTLDAEEKSLSIGCPHVGRLLKEIPGTLSFVCFDNGVAVDMNAGLEPAIAEKLQIDIWMRDQLIDCIQLKNHPLWFRVYMGYLALNVTRNAYKENQYQDIAKAMGEIFSPQGSLHIWNQYIHQERNDVNLKFQQHQIIVSAVKGVVFDIVGKDRRENNKIVESIYRAADRITIDAYQELCQKTKDFFQQEEYFFENVMVVLLFEELLKAYDDQEYIMNNYHLLMIFYMLMKYYMQLYIFENGSINEETELVIVAILGRCFMHGKGNFVSVVQTLKQSEWWNPAQIMKYLMEES